MHTSSVQQTHCHLTLFTYSCTYSSWMYTLYKHYTPEIWRINEATSIHQDIQSDIIASMQHHTHWKLWNEGWRDKRYMINMQKTGLGETLADQLVSQISLHIHLEITPTERNSFPWIFNLFITMNEYTIHAIRKFGNKWNPLSYRQPAALTHNDSFGKSLWFPNWWWSTDKTVIVVMIHSSHWKGKKKGNSWKEIVGI